MMADCLPPMRFGSLTHAAEWPGEHDVDAPHAEKTVLDIRIQNRLTHRMRAGGMDEGDLQACLCVLMMVDALRTHNKPTFVCKELAQEASMALGVLEMLSIDLDMTRVTYIIANDAFCTVHRSVIAASTDVKRQMDVLAIVAGVVRGELTALEAMDLINSPEHGGSDWCTLWRDWPARILIFPLLAFSSSGSFYGGSFYDATFATAIGLVVGVFYFALVKKLPNNRHLRTFSEMATACILGFLAIAANEIAKRFDIELCFQAITIANLFFFLKGTDSAFAFLEAIEGNFSAATQRLLHALVGTLLLGLGMTLGVWAAAFGGPERWDVLGKLACPPQLGLASSAALYVFVLVGAMLDMKVDLPEMPFVFMAQVATVISGPLERYISAPSFVATLVATQLMVLTAKVGLTLLQASGTHLPVVALADVKIAPSTRRQRPDLWGAIMPSVYVLSAGSSFYRTGLTAFLRGLSADGEELFDSGIQYMGSLFAVSLAIAVGVKVSPHCLRASKGLGCDRVACGECIEGVGVLRRGRPNLCAQCETFCICRLQCCCFLCQPFAPMLLFCPIPSLFCSVRSYALRPFQSAFALISAIESMTDPKWYRTQSERHLGSCSAIVNEGDFGDDGGENYDAGAGYGAAFDGNGNHDGGGSSAGAAAVSVRRQGSGRSNGGGFGDERKPPGVSTRLIKQGSIGVRSIRFAPGAAAAGSARSRAVTAPTNLA
ncbi:unnamed protein product [Phaeothamnion confervicola]